MFGVVQLKRRNRCYTDTLLDERIKSWFWPAQDLLGNEPLPRETSSPDMVLMYDMIKRTFEQNQSGLPHELLYFVLRRSQTWWNKAGLHKVRCFGLILWQFATLTERARVVQLACPSKMRKKVDSRVRTLARDSVVSTNSEYQTTQT